MDDSKYAVVLAYRGTLYQGWQRQADEDALETPISIQATLERTLSKICSEPITCVGSGRTDSGVHALGQVAHFFTRRKSWDTKILMRALNSTLPPDIRARGVYEVPVDFHSQKSAEKKQYSYYFQQGPCALPHLEPYSWWIRKELDLEAMREAAAMLVGEHDFLPFRASGAKPGSSVRTIFEAEVTTEPTGFPAHVIEGVELVRVRLIGSGFLKQMVRGICGTLLEIGEGRRPVSDMRAILTVLDRQMVGPTAPARALWLERVWYGKTLGF